MADSTGDSGTSRGATDDVAPPGMPRWVKVFGIVVLALILFAIMIATGIGGHHGPRRHMRSGKAAGDSAPPAAAQRP